MAAGLAALLDDIALIAKKAAATTDDVAAIAGRTSTKAAGVVIDDAAVTPKFVAGVSPARELPIIWKITKGSLVNKLIIILPIILLLSWLLPGALTPLLMLGGFYLSFEGAEKVLEKVGLGGHGEGESDDGDEEKDQSESALVRGAIFTDLILSAEIMVISLNEVSDQPLLTRALVLILVGLMVTFAVYGVVGVLIKIDDIGLAIAHKQGASEGMKKFGLFLVKGMPKLLTAIGIIGTLAMLWVGGHILLVGFDELGLHWPYQAVHHVVENFEHLGGAVTWLMETGFSLLFGLLVGALIAVVVGGVKKLRAR
ncbi:MULTISPECIES: DUF808 domain-containing protein [unclassified Corynebacterium]|uniref:DUF808 domain-containing protein n=1 Tax=unclassified Corynebacterium TaxID=2624378 RepID=UPI001EF57556|nr:MULTISPECIES: DUF808 domain-containing protein [unclassified Corynebacterium]MCG7258221.1 DUF808 domain-containing protein [Corynebacterium sp. ACRQK]MCG7262655.1 DUF808 domain-containing protein [Corynebacterium sp. ACRQL]